MKTTVVKVVSGKVVRNGKGIIPRLLLLLLITLSPYHLITLAFAAFQDYGWGVRPEGMGGAFTAVSDDSNALFYNPAGLYQVKRKEINAMVAKPYAGVSDINMSFFRMSGIYSLGKFGTPGVNVSRYQLQDIYSEIIYTFGYGYKVTDNFAIGGNLKMLQWQINYDEEILKSNDPIVQAGNGKSSLSMDLGVILKPEEGNFRFGLMVKDMNRPNVGLVKENKIPDEYRLGSVYYFGDVKYYEQLKVALDFTFRNQEFGETSDKYNMHVGLESWFYGKKAAARTGFNLQSWTLGGSYVLPMSDSYDNFEIQVDYNMTLAIRTVGNDYGTHRFSFGIGF